LEKPGKTPGKADRWVVSYVLSPFGPCVRCRTGEGQLGTGDLGFTESPQGGMIIDSERELDTYEIS
jgi:hypothetical protein